MQRVLTWMQISRGPKGIDQFLTCNHQMIVCSPTGMFAQQAVVDVVVRAWLYVLPGDSVQEHQGLTVWAYDAVVAIMTQGWNCIQGEVQAPWLLLPAAAGQNN